MNLPNILPQKHIFVNVPKITITDIMVIVIHLLISKKLIFLGGNCSIFLWITLNNFNFNLVSSQGQFIVAGSDDGLFFVWDRNTENNLLILKGDSSIVNCLQPHPSEFMLATSGIDNEVKLWTPLSDVKIITHNFN